MRDAGSQRAKVRPVNPFLPFELIPVCKHGEQTMFVKNSSGENNVTSATVESIAWTMHPVGEGSIVELSTGVIGVPIQPFTDAKWNWVDACHLAQ